MRELVSSGSRIVSMPSLGLEPEDNQRDADPARAPGQVSPQPAPRGSVIPAASIARSGRPVDTLLSRIKKRKLGQVGGRAPVVGMRKQVRDKDLLVPAFR